MQTDPSRIIWLYHENLEGPVWLATGMADPDSLAFPADLVQDLEAWGLLQPSLPSTDSDKNRDREYFRRGQILAQRVADAVGSEFEVHFDDGIYRGSALPQTPAAALAVMKYGSLSERIGTTAQVRFTARRRRS